MMSISNLEQAIIHYQQTLTVLERLAPSDLTTENILNILIARDHLQKTLTETPFIPATILTTLDRLDDLLKIHQATIAPIIAELRPKINPDTKNWWWLLETPKIPSQWEKWDFLSNAASITFLTISLGLISEITSRFLSGGSDTFGGIVISVQSVLTLLTAGGVLTQTGQEAGKRFLKNHQISEKYWQEIGAFFSLLIMLSLFGLRLSLPTIANQYVKWGDSDYKKGDLSSAEEDYKRALSLNPDDAEAHFDLGLIYEELQNFTSAKTEYVLAMQGGNITAINNLARLYILDKNYPSAVNLLLKAQQDQKNLDQEIQYAISKNLGWARLKQEDFAGAETALLEAINFQKSANLQENIAASHCLLAQVREAQKNKKEALKEWEICNEKANGLNPDEDSWRIQAQKALTSQEQSK
jgi:Tfp pilus assembly protein PilF